MTLSVYTMVMPLISHTHGTALCIPKGAEAEIACDCCSKRFFRKAKFVNADLRRGRKRFFCSTDCRAKGSVTTGTTKPRQFVCQHCQVSFEAVHADKKKTRKFCSMSCSAKYNKNGRGRDYSKPRLYKEKFELRGYMEFGTEEKDREMSSVSKKPKGEPRKKAVYLDRKCEGCGKDVRRRESEIKKSKHGKSYCSKSCRMKHYNAHILVRSSTQRSRAEDYLFEMMVSDFPSLKIIKNDRSFLSEHLEIDLYMPDIRLAIELNGPVHYLPIYGDERFKRVQIKDAKKNLELHQKGVALLTLDISRLQSKKKTIAFLSAQYSEVIKPLIMEARVGVPPTIG